MRIYYWGEYPNFGDQLNPWLWPRLLPELFRIEDDGTDFLGIGTLLDHGFLAGARQARRIIFGTGAGYSDRPDMGPAWKIYCVRGPLTAQLLGIDPGLAITDPAVLLRRYLRPGGRPKCWKASLVLHWQSVNLNWRLAAEAAGIHFIDPRDPVDQVLKQIDESELVLAEAMHGAICADALRVPWVPILSRPDILAFKWHDWCETLGFAYRAEAVPYLGHFGGDGHEDVLRARVGDAAERLRLLVAGAAPLLSTEARSLESEERLLEKCEELRRDYASGSFRR